MSLPREHEPFQLYLSILSSRWEEFWSELEPRLKREFGPTDYLSQLIPFTQTKYYDKEFGSPLFRRILSFERLVPPDGLVDIKLLTNRIELEYSKGPEQRMFNLDPGLLSLERLVLATGKNYTHRIYLGRGIWADLCLIFQRGGWRELDWTFPDYAGEEMKFHLERIRSIYKQKIDSLGQGEASKESK